MTPPTPNLTPTEARVLAAVDMDGLLDTISRLVAIPTDQGRETPAQEQMAEWMRAAGMEVDVWEIDFDKLRTHPRFSTEIERGTVARAWWARSDARTDLGRSLILNGHVDVVSAGRRVEVDGPSLAGHHPRRQPGGPRRAGHEGGALLWSLRGAGHRGGRV